MSAALNITDVPSVRPEHLYMPMRHLIAQGRGLALLNGLTDSDLRNLDSEIWAGFADQPELRLAVALRFRALLDVFDARRLKNLLLRRGFKLIAMAIAQAATQRLNTNYGFSAQRFVAALDKEPATTIARSTYDTQLPLAA